MRRDYVGPPVFAASERRAERTDAPAFDKHVAQKDLVLAVERDNSRTFNQ
jgi:hypothetical protein